MMAQIQAPDGFDQDAWDGAVSAVREYCGWHIAPLATETLILDGPGGRLLLLPSLRVSGVTAVTNDGVDVTGLEWSEAGLVVADCEWSHKYRGITVSLSHGYAALPSAVEAVVRSLVKDALTPAGVKSQTMGPFSVTYASESTGGALSSIQKMALEPYRVKART